MFKYIQLKCKHSMENSAYVTRHNTNQQCRYTPKLLADGMSDSATEQLCIYSVFTMTCNISTGKMLKDVQIDPVVLVYVLPIQKHTLKLNSRSLLGTDMIRKLPQRCFLKVQ
jgi:hypothetical protein